MKRSLFYSVAIVLATLSVTAQQPGSRVPTVALAPVGKVQAKSGSIKSVQLDFRIGNDFHINSYKPKSELLIPTSLKLAPKEPLSLAAVQFPPGEDISFPFSPGEKLSVYSGDFSVTAAIKVPVGTAAGDYPVAGELHFQACDRSACYPPRSIPVTFTVSVAK